jgi:hypothetical protein
MLWIEENTCCLKLTKTTGLAVTCDTTQAKSFPVVGKNFIFKEVLLMVSCVSGQVHWAADMAAKSPLPKEDAGVALVAVATCAAATSDKVEEDDSGLPPCQEVAGDPWGSFIPATTEGGG